MVGVEQGAADEHAGVICEHLSKSQIATTNDEDVIFVGYSCAYSKGFVVSGKVTLDRINRVCGKNCGVSQPVSNYKCGWVEIDVDEAVSGRGSESCYASNDVNTVAEGDCAGNGCTWSVTQG